MPDETKSKSAKPSASAPATPGAGGRITPPPSAELPRKPTPLKTADADAPGNADKIRSIVAEIRERLADIARRELDVQKRERELEQRYDRLPARPAAPPPDTAADEVRRRLATRSGELDEQAIELVARRTRIEQVEAQLVLRQVELEKSQKALALERERLVQDLNAQQAEVLTARQNLLRRIAVIRDRERELERRIRAARDEVVRLRAEMDARRSELEALSLDIEGRRVDLEARAAEWDERVTTIQRTAAEVHLVEQEVRVAREELERERRRLETTQSEVTQQAQALRAAESEFHSVREKDRRTLLKRIEAIRQREQELEKRLKLARDEVSQRRGELDEQLGEVGRRAAELRGLTTAHEQRQAAVTAQTEDLERQRAALQEERGELDAVRAQLEQAREELAAQRHALGERQRELDREGRKLKDRERDLARHGEELAARRRAAEDDDRALAERLSRVEQREQQLNLRAGSLNEREARLRQMDEEVGARRGEIDALFEQIAEGQRLIAAERDELATQRERTEARDAEVRQLGLSLEVERQALVKDRAALEVAQQALDASREAQQRELIELKVTVTEQSRQLDASRNARVAAPRHWIARSTLLATVVGLASGLAWLAREQPAFVGSAELRIEGDSDEARLHAHAGALLSDSRMSAALHAGGGAAEWREARAQGRVSVTPDPTRHVVRLAVRGPEAPAAQRLASAAAQGFARTAAQPPTPALAAHPPSVANLAVALRGELKTAGEQLALVSTRLAAAATSGVRADRAAELEALEGEFAALSRRIEQQRAEVVGLRGQTPPKAELDPKTLEKALADDKIFVEDSAEFRSNTRQYQVELGAALVALEAPLSGAKKAVGGLATAIAEQRALEPPPNIATALEQLAELGDRLQTQVLEFGEGLARRRASIEQLQVEEDVVELVRIQNSAAEDVRKLVSATAATLGELRSAVGHLTEGSSNGTRELVVASVIRGELARLEEIAPPLGEAARNLDTSVNFKLDSFDRQLRGLKTRLGQRREAVATELQQQADRLLREMQAAHTLELSEQLAELDRQRETLVTALVRAALELRAADADLLQRESLERQAAELNQRVTWLEVQLRQAEAASTADGPALAPERLTVVEGRPVQIAGQERFAHASLAAGVGFATTWLACILMVLRVPGLATRRPA